MIILAEDTRHNCIVTGDGVILGWDQYGAWNQSQPTSLHERFEMNKKDFSTDIFSVHCVLVCTVYSVLVADSRITIRV